MQVDAEGMSQPLLIQQLNTPGQHLASASTLTGTPQTQGREPQLHTHVGHTMGGHMITQTFIYIRTKVILLDGSHGKGFVCLGLVISTKRCRIRKSSYKWHLGKVIMGQWSWQWSASSPPLGEHLSVFRV